MSHQSIRRGADGSFAQSLQQRHGYDRQEIGHHFSKTRPVRPYVLVSHRVQRHHHSLVANHRLRHRSRLLCAPAHLPHIGQVHSYHSKMLRIDRDIPFEWQRTAAIGESYESTGRVPLDGDIERTVYFASIRSAATFFADHVRATGHPYVNRSSPEFHQQVARLCCGNNVILVNNSTL